MDINNFYDFSSKFYGTTFMAIAINSPSKKKPNGLPNNYDYNLVAGKYDNIDFPVIFKYEDGKHLRDIIDTGTAVLFLISKKFKTILEKNKLTGWKTFPVKVYDKKNQEIPNYYGLTVTGRCGPIDYSKCETYKTKYVEHGPFVKIYKGKYIGLDKWDGSDFFLPIGNYGIIVTEKVANLLKNNKLTNIDLEKLSKVETPESTVKPRKKNRKKDIANFPMNVDK
ncbi:hypothetical protein KKG71_02375 [Patescibacteria group bacterium]|nr:hypothetical protein [Patescibacteria group bacterium]